MRLWRRAWGLAILGLWGLAQGTDTVLRFELRNLKGSGSGVFWVTLRPEWAPRGVERLLQLVEQKFYDKCRVFRVVKGFVAQFGISGDPATSAKWRSNMFQDDKVLTS